MFDQSLQQPPGFPDPLRDVSIILARARATWPNFTAGPALG